MNIFLDTANLEEIKQALDWGVLDGVTTSPAAIARTGRPSNQLLADICSLVNGPISAETTSMHADGIVNQARDLAAIHPNVVVKVPLMKEGLKAVKALADEGIRCNVTVTFTPMQALLAAKAGACFVTPLVDRLNRIGEDAFDMVEQIKKIFDNYRIATKLLVAGIRSPYSALQAALAGADICSMPFEVLSILYSHPLSEQGIDISQKDAARIPAPPPAVPPALPRETIREPEIRAPEEPPKLAAVADPPRAAAAVVAAADLSRTPSPLHITPSKTPPAIIMRRSASGKSGSAPVVKVEGPETPTTPDSSTVTPAPESESNSSPGSP